MEIKLLESYLNREGGSYIVVSYKTHKSYVIITYRYRDFEHTGQLEVPLFYLLSFVYSEITAKH